MPISREEAAQRARAAASSAATEVRSRFNRWGISAAVSRAAERAGSAAASAAEKARELRDDGRGNSSSSSAVPVAVQMAVPAAVPVAVPVAEEKEEEKQEELAKEEVKEEVRKRAATASWQHISSPDHGLFVLRMTAAAATTVSEPAAVAQENKVGANGAAGHTEKVALNDGNVRATAAAESSTGAGSAPLSPRVSTAASLFSPLGGAWGRGAATTTVAMPNHAAASLSCDNDEPMEPPCRLYMQTPQGFVALFSDNGGGEE